MVSGAVAVRSSGLGIAVRLSPTAYYFLLTALTHLSYLLLPGDYCATRRVPDQRQAEHASPGRTGAQRGDA